MHVVFQLAMLVRGTAPFLFITALHKAEEDACLCLARNNFYMCYVSTCNVLSVITPFPLTAGQSPLYCKMFAKFCSTAKYHSTNSPFNKQQVTLRCVRMPSFREHSYASAGKAAK